MRPEIEVIYTKGLEVLAKFDHERSLGRLVKQLDHWHEDVRRGAVRALGNCWVVDSRAVKPLIGRLTDWDEGVRRETRRTLRETRRVFGEVDVDETVEPLIRGDETAVEPLIEKLSGNEYVREAMLALGDLGDKRAVEPLIEKLSDPGKYIRVGAREALVSLDDERANRLLARFRAFDSPWQELVHRLTWRDGPYESGAPLAWNLAKGNEEKFQINLQILESATKQFVAERPRWSNINKRIQYTEFIYTVARYAMEQEFSPENSLKFFKLFIENLVITTKVDRRQVTALRQGRYLYTRWEGGDPDQGPWPYVGVAVYEQIPYKTYKETRIEEEDMAATLEKLKADYPEALKAICLGKRAEESLDILV